MTPQQWIQIFDNMRWALTFAANPFAGLLWLTWHVLADTIGQVINLLVV